MGTCFALVVMVGVFIASTPGDRTTWAADPSVCQSAPRTVEEMIALAATPTEPRLLDPGSGLPAGGPAARQVEWEIRQTARELVACTSSGTPLQMYALLTDRAVSEGLQGVDVDDLRGSLERPPVAETGPARLVALWDVTVLPDGRVGALLAFGSSEVQTRYAVFVRDGERWLIDELHSEGELLAIGVDVAVPSGWTEPVPVASPGAVATP